MNWSKRLGLRGMAERQVVVLHARATRFPATCWSILMEIYHKKNIGIALVVFNTKVNPSKREITEI
jgi:hypothetical protein